MESLPPGDYALGDPDRLCYVVLTSGSSGTPMPVAHAHRAVWARRMMREDWEGLSSADRLLHAGALNWTFTLGTGLLDPWAAGATALIPAPGVTSAQLPLLMRRHDVTIFASAPGVIRQMLRTGPMTLPKLRHGLCAGETLPATLREDWQNATTTDLHEALGMSECSTFLSGCPARPAPAGHIGFPQRGRRVAILGDAECGELAIHRSDPGLMLGYLFDEAATRARFDGDWFRTGDLVALGNDGALRYLGRTDDLMNAGGFRVSPVEIEDVLRCTPGIEDLAVTEIEVKPGVRIIVCAYMAEDDRTEALTACSTEGLAPWKRPRVFQRVASLPRNPNSKLNRRRLREEWTRTE